MNLRCFIILCLLHDRYFDSLQWWSDCKLYILLLISFQLNMDQLSGLATVLVLSVVCLAVTFTTAIPVSLGSFGEYNSDIDTLDFYDSCALCISYSDADACALCNYETVEHSVAKRSGRFNPLLRGQFPKKNYQYYNPLSRGSYLKKSYSPLTRVYHPFLRGGYRGPVLPQRSYWNLDNEQEEPWNKRVYSHSMLTSVLVQAEWMSKTEYEVIEQK